MVLILVECVGHTQTEMLELLIHTASMNQHHKLVQTLIDSYDWKSMKSASILNVELESAVNLVDVPRMKKLWQVPLHAPCLLSGIFISQNPNIEHTEDTLLTFFKGFAAANDIWSLEPVFDKLKALQRSSIIPFHMQLH